MEKILLWGEDGGQCSQLGGHGVGVGGRRVCGSGFPVSGVWADFGSIVF